MPKAEVSSVLEARLPPHKKGLATHHNRDHQEMMAEEEETPQEVVEVTVEVEEPPTIAINATSWDIDHSNVQIMKKPDTKAYIQRKVKKKA